MVLLLSSKGFESSLNTRFIKSRVIRFLLYLCKQSNISGHVSIFNSRRRKEIFGITKVSQLRFKGLYVKLSETCDIRLKLPLNNRILWKFDRLSLLISNCNLLYDVSTIIQFILLLFVKYSNTFQYTIFIIGLNTMFMFCFFDL